LVRCGRRIGRSVFQNVAAPSPDIVTGDVINANYPDVMIHEV